MLLSALKNIFGYDDFKSEIQKDATTAIYEGKENVCLCMPSGSGKSLCFQLPTVMQRAKVAIIFSPTLPAIRKQIEFLRSKRLSAYLFTSKCNMRQRKVIINDLLSKLPKIKFLYVTPETGLSTDFQNVMTKLKKHKAISYVIFEEAQSLCQRSPDFRPCYKKFQPFKLLCYTAPVIAITGTVTEDVLNDLCEVLSIKHSYIFRILTFQSNIHYDVWFVETLYKPYGHLKNFIIETLGLLDISTPKDKQSTGIIYCRKKDTTEIIAKHLTAFGIPTVAYHAGLKVNTQKDIKDKWNKREIHVIATTYKFGVDIHKKSVRCIVHWTIPESIFRYYQECGKVDRDDHKVFCRLYFSLEEYLAILYYINAQHVQDTEQEEAKVKEFKKSITYCLDIRCRHQMISEYFAENISNCRTNCDVCKDKDTVDLNVFKFKRYVEHKSVLSNNEILNHIKCLTFYNTCNIDSYENRNTIENITVDKENETLAQKFVGVINDVTNKQSIPAQHVQIDSNNIDNTVSHEPLTRTENYKKRNRLKSSVFESKISGEHYFELQPTIEIINLDEEEDKLDNKESFDKLEKTDIFTTHKFIDKRISNKPYVTKKDNWSSHKTNRNILLNRHLKKGQMKNGLSTDILSVELQDNNNINGYNTGNRDKMESSTKSINVEVRKNTPKSTKHSTDVSVLMINELSGKNNNPFITKKSQLKVESSKKRNIIEVHYNEPDTGKLKRLNCNDNSLVIIEQIKKNMQDNSNIAVTSDHVTAEYLMNKYKLNKDVITLTPRK